jgi:hypothetical protein
MTAHEIGAEGGSIYRLTGHVRAPRSMRRRRGGVRPA